MCPWFRRTAGADGAEFAALVRRAGAACDPAERVRGYGRALGLWRGTARRGTARHGTARGTTGGAD